MLLFRSRACIVAVLSVLGAAACGGSTASEGPSDAPDDATSPSTDSGALPPKDGGGSSPADGDGRSTDASAPPLTDAGAAPADAARAPHDAGAPPPADAGTADTSTSPDAGSPVDASLVDVVTSPDASTSPSTPGFVTCGEEQCDLSTAVCCIAFNPTTYTCTPLGTGCHTTGGVADYFSIACDEPADCPDGDICRQRSSDPLVVDCTSAGPLGPVLCKSNADCGDAGSCQTTACPGDASCLLPSCPFSTCTADPSCR
jgi:hypothetical protein